jgi:hypothetical protein
MAPGNSELLDYFLVAAGKLLLTKDGKKLRISDWTFGQSRLGSLGAVLRTLHDIFELRHCNPRPLDGLHCTCSQGNPGAPC